MYLERRAEKERWRIAVVVALHRLGDRRRKNKASSRVGLDRLFVQRVTSGPAARPGTA